MLTHSPTQLRDSAVTQGDIVSSHLAITNLSVNSPQIRHREAVVKCFVIMQYSTGFLQPWPKDGFDHDRFKDVAIFAFVSDEFAEYKEEASCQSVL